MAPPEEQQKIFEDAVSEIEERLRQITQIAVTKLFANPDTMSDFRTATNRFLQDLRPIRR
jgi:hypothetical protein